VAVDPEKRRCDRFAPGGVAVIAFVVDHAAVSTRLGSLAIRLALPAALIGMTAVGGAGPAQAAEPEVERPKVVVAVGGPVVAITGGSKSVPVQVRNDGATPAPGLILDFGSAAAPIDPRVGFQPPPGCTATGCVVGDLAPFTIRQYAFTVKPTAALPAAGVTFELAAHDASGTWRETTIVKVVPGGQGPDLEVAGIPEFTLKAGESAVLPISVRNSGNKRSERVIIELVGEQYLTFPHNYSNCVTGPEQPGIVCAFEQPLAPGAVLTMSPSTPLTVGIEATAPGAKVYHGAVYAFGFEDDGKPAQLAAARKALQQPGTKLQLVPAVRSLAVEQRDLNTWDNSTAIMVKVARNPADSVAIGGTFEGKAGATRTIKVGMRNDGPAWVLRQNEQWSQEAKVRIPSGVKLTKVDSSCAPIIKGEPNWTRKGQVSGRDYLCVASEDVGIGKQRLFSFTAKIQNGKNEDAGSITVNGGAQDPKTANNVAKIEVKLTAAAGGTGGSGGGLPITGTPTAQVAVAGLLLVLLGGFTMRVTRRHPTA
jgi:hypothetical protein